ncbi:tetratricopeptide repeat protein [Arthrobacter sp. CAN_C5]|uniref:tetratricopeptide repeat protein n=1 Tax=Arthrobacter sp. CAN_C5 TaxID=2760706 RepID=UPI001AE161D3|nr:tetratricopeptide repeat protein [Arthrobacter sp. CAN_C5]MBP2216161.1 putative thioredoxin [Arthrobacter sp. CAN_C5]
MSIPNNRGPLPPSSMNLHGAVDLSALKARAEAARTAPQGGAPAAGNGQQAEAQPASGAGAAGSPYVVEVTEQSFPQLVQLSSQVPVVVDLRAGWSEESSRVTAVLEAIAVEHDGKVLLAKVDVETQPQIAQAFQAQTVPTVVAVLKGQPVPLFEGAVPEQQIRSFIDELLKVAGANGVAGSLREGADAEGAEAAAEEPPLPPHHQAAFDAIEAGDYLAAAASYRQALAEQPADAEAKAGLAQVELMQRLKDVDAATIRQRAADEPDILESQLAVADLDVSGGHVEDGFARIVAFISRTAGEPREAARVRLLELFDVVGVADPRVTKARGALARALF